MPPCPAPVMRRLQFQFSLAALFWLTLAIAVAFATTPPLFASIAGDWGKFLVVFGSFWAPPVIGCIASGVFGQRRRAALVFCTVWAALALAVTHWLVRFL